MSNVNVQPEQIVVGAIVEIAFGDIDHTLFGIVTNVDDKERKKFVAETKKFFTVCVMLQEQDGSFDDPIYSLTSIDNNQIVRVGKKLVFKNLI